MLDSLIIQSAQLTALESDFREHRCAAYLLVSVDEEYLDAFSRAMVGRFLCSTNNACGNCDSCKKLLLNKHPDLIFVSDNIITVDMVKDMIAKSTILPMIGDRKVFLVQAADAMNEYAQNKMLKTLEEPPESCVFIFTTTSPARLLPTVVSRMKRVELQPLDITKELNANDIVTAEANYAQLTESRTVEYRRMYALGMKVFTELLDISDLPRLNNEIFESSKDKDMFLKVLLRIYRDALRQGAGVGRNFFVQKLSTHMGSSQLLNAIAAVDKAYKRKKANVYWQYVLDAMMIEIINNEVK